MLKIKLLAVLFCLPLFTFANMAKPWTDGAKHTIFYTTQNCSVTNENIVITLDKDEIYSAKYKITYQIYSESNQTIPLVFLGLDLYQSNAIIVNNDTINSIPIVDINNFPFLKPAVYPDDVQLKYTETDEIYVAKKDLIYFHADLKEGNNIVEISYSGNLEHNVYGFETTYKIEYSLYPSKFWKSFGPITIELDLNDQLEIVNSNYKYSIQNNKYIWKIDKITNEIFEAKFKQKTSIISKILLTINPLGFAILSLICLGYLHFRLLKIKQQSQLKKFKYILLIGNFVVPILVYVVFFLSFNLIDFSLGNHNSKHGYVFLHIFSLPLIIIFYSIFMYLLDRLLNKKYNKNLDE